MNVATAILRKSVDGLMSPFAGGGAWAPLLAVSLLLAVCILLIIKVVSNQRALQRTKGRAMARVLELHLFRHNLAGIFPTFGRVVWAVLVYLKESARGVVLAIIPILLLLYSLEGWFKYRPLRVGERAIATVHLKADAEAAPERLRISASDGVAVETDAFIPHDATVAAWRIAPVAEGGGQWVEIADGDRTLRKTVAIGSGLQRVSPRRGQGGVWELLANVGEPALAAGHVESIDINYPERRILLGRFDVDWVVAIFVLSIAFALVLRYPLRVEL